MYKLINFSISILILSSLGYTKEINCNKDTINRFSKLLEKKEFTKELKEIEAIYKDCKSYEVQAIYFMAKGDEYESNKMLKDAGIYYIKSLNNFENSNSNFFGNLQNIKNYLAMQIAKYNIIKADMLSKSFVLHSNLTAKGATLYSDNTISIPLNFATGKYNIDKNYNLKQATEILKALKDKNYSKIYITGYTDTRGKFDFNSKLGEQRANALKEFLQKEGYSGKIEIDTKGEMFPICKEGEITKNNNEFACSVFEDYYHSRRVIISYEE